jgi:hypothetical protein
VRVLERDPDLLEATSPARAERARGALVSRTLKLDRGTWSQPRWGPGVTAGIGLLVLDGLLYRRIRVGTGGGGELVGPGDLLRPWEQLEGERLICTGAPTWKVLEPATLAMLDQQFTTRLLGYPEIAGQLMGRAIQRAQRLALGSAIAGQARVDARVLVVLWQLAERFGRVRPDGVLVAVPLTHSILADLAGTRRPSVTLSLHELERHGSISRVQGGWLLRGPRPAPATAFASPGRL